MTTNYEKIMRDNLSRIYSQLPADLEERLIAKKWKNRFCFRAFGEDCCLGPNMITLSGKSVVDPRGLLISLYARHASPKPIQLEPFIGFREFPNSIPYQAAFCANSEMILVCHVSTINKKQEMIKHAFDGRNGFEKSGGDFSFILFPLPKIALWYIFYQQDEEFAASVTCLFSANALSFMPIDGLADVAEYTSKRMIQLIRK